MVDVILPRAVGADGTNGATPVFSIGTVTTGTPAVVQTGTALNPVLNFTFPASGAAPPFAISDTTGLQGALDAKAPLASPTFTGTVSGITAAMVGLGNVDNTSDANKPVSTATQTALNLKANLASPTFTGTVTLPAGQVVNGVTLSTAGGTTVFLRGDGTYAAPAGGGTGDVVGPASATADAVAIYNGTTGKLLKDGPLLASLATLASPALSGTPTAPTASAGTNTTQVATTAFATAAVLDAKPIQALGFALSDTTTAITTGNAKLTVRMPYAFTLLSGASGVRASLSTASSSGIPTVDINENGTTILSTKLTIDASEKTSTTAAVPAVISDTSLADDAEITFDIDVAGTGAVGLVVWLIGRRT